MNDKELSKKITKAFNIVAGIEKKKSSKIKQCPYCKTWTGKKNTECPKCGLNY